MKNIDIGKTFGRLTVLPEEHVEAYSGTRKIYKTHCLCSCGTRVLVESSSVRNGHTKSCGCLVRDNLSKRRTTHQGTGTKLHYIWAQMKTRCYNDRSHGYTCYGGRGIKICEAWLDFAEFRNWAYANGYQEGLTIDRINNDGNYEPSNCRWITQSENSKAKAKRILRNDGLLFTNATEKDCFLRYEYFSCLF